MMIIGCDFHTRQQHIAMLDTETGELVEQRLEHANGEARKFYEGLPKPVRVGIEATGYTRWFERLLAELGHELWVGDAAAIRASVVRKQKNDRRDAAHILNLLVENRFPRQWMPTPAEQDLRQLVLHRVKLVQMRTKVMNQCTRWSWEKGCAGRRSCGTGRVARNWPPCHWGRGPRGGGESYSTGSISGRNRLPS
jgi:transposase